MYHDDFEPKDYTPSRTERVLSWCLATALGVVFGLLLVFGLSA
jgi:hypothetical protein